MRTLEKPIEKAILQYLEFVDDCYAWKNNTVGIYDKAKGIYRKSRSKYAINGTSDILGVYRGRFLAIEVKTPQTKNRPSEDQRMFIERINYHGGIAFIATSVEDVQQALESLDE